MIASAADGAAEVLKKSKDNPTAVLSFNCAGRRSKLNEYEDELVSMQKVLGKDVTLFGCYCAGEIGPVDEPDAPEDVLSGGSGWHVMFTTITPGKAKASQARQKRLANVSGRITFNGQPVEGAVITLIAQKGQPVAQGTTDAVGKYTLKTMKGDSRIPAGAFGVTISKTLKGSRSGEEKALLPLKYAMRGTSGLAVEVVAPGVNEFDFELCSP